jgi:hypothetical protein
VLQDVEPWTSHWHGPGPRGGLLGRGEAQAARVLTDEEPEAPADVEPQGDVSLDINSEVRGALDALRAIGGDSPVAPQSRPPRKAARRTGGKRKRSAAATEEETQAKRTAKPTKDTGLVRAVWVHGKPVAVPVQPAASSDEGLTPPRQTSPGPDPMGTGGEISPLGSTGMQSPTSRRSRRKAAVRAKSKIAATARKEAEEEPPTDYLTDSEDEGRDRSGGPPLGPPLGPTARSTARSTEA